MSLTSLMYSTPPSKCTRSFVYTPHSISDAANNKAYIRWGNIKSNQWDRAGPILLTLTSKASRKPHCLIDICLSRPHLDSVMETWGLLRKAHRSNGVELLCNLFASKTNECFFMAHSANLFVGLKNISDWPVVIRNPFISAGYSDPSL